MEAGPRSKKPQNETIAHSLIPSLIGVVACAIVFFVPFFPDEKLVRLKLEALELGIFLLTLFVGIKVINSKTESDRPVLLYSVLCWFFVNILLWGLSSEKSLASSEIRRIFLATAAFAAFSLSGMNDVWRRRFLLSWSFAGGLLAIYGILQHTGGFWMIQVPKMERVMGTYGNPIFFAAYLVPTFFLTIHALTLEKSPLIRILLGLAGGVQFLASYATQTRAALIALVVCFVVGLIWNATTRRVPFAIWLGLLFVVGAAAFQSKNVWGRDQGHLLIWRDTVRMWQDHPIKGVGLGAFHTNFPSYAQDDLKSKWPKGDFIVNDAHNEYLQILSETGLIGLVVFLAIPFVFFFIQRERSWLAVGVAAIFLQNFFSVDMRFGISLANAFMLMGFALSPRQSVGRGPGFPEENLDPGQRHAGMTKLKMTGVTIWVLFLFGLVLPAILKPYRAQKKLAATPNFFDQRLLDPAKSTSDLEKLSLEYPQEAAILEKLAYVYAKEIKSVDGKMNSEAVAKAIDAYQRLIRLDPHRMSAYNNLANVYYTLGQSAQAIATWKKAIEIAPSFVDAHLNLGKVLYVQGDLKESASQFEKVLKLDPGNNEAIVYLKRMVE